MSSPETPMAGSAARTDRVFGLAMAHAARQAAARQCRQVLPAALAAWREAPLARRYDPAAGMAPLVYGGIWGDEVAAEPLAAATILLSAGLELGTALPSLPADQRAWALSTLAVALPHQIVATLEAPVPVRGLLHATLAERIPCLLVYAEPVESAHRAGALCALAAMLGAQLAGAAPRVAEACCGLGWSLGMGSWLAADCDDLFRAGWSTVLAGGGRALPLALHLARLRGREGAAFEALLDQARTDAAAQAAVRARLLSAGEPARWAFVKEVYGRRARRALTASGLLEPARRQLHTMIAALAADTYSVQEQIS